MSESCLTTVEGSLHLRERVRQRPGMFFGDTDTGEAIVNIAETLIAEPALVRGARRIHLRSRQGGLAVEDDGRGFLPRDFQLDRECQLAPIIAASRRFSAAGGRWQVKAEEGIPLLSPSLPPLPGNRVDLELDARLFESGTDPDLPCLFARARELAALWPGVAITLGDKRYGERCFLYPGGLADFVAEQVPVRNRSGRVFAFTTENLPFELDFALLFGTHVPQQIFSFVSYSRVNEGGVHVDAAQLALRDILGFAIAERGLALAVAVCVPAPRFAGSVRERLLGDEVGAFVYQQLMARAPELRAAVGWGGRPLPDPPQR